VPVFTSHDGAVLHYDLLGEGRSAEPIVVLAGGPARHPEYLDDLAGLDTVRTLVMLHQRGVGGSEAAGPAPLPDLVHDVEALRVHLELGRLDLLGHSAGTRMAQVYAARHPDRLKRLCLVTPPSLWLVEAEDDRAAMIDSRRGEPWFEAFERARPQIEAVTTVKEFRPLAALAAPIGWATWDERAQQHETTGELFISAADIFFSSPAEPGLAGRLASVTVPVLVIAGADDAVTGLAPVLALAELFPDGRSTVIEAAGHYPWVEQPTAFRRAVDPFFS
jgi:proline iminopeptidase